MGILINRGRVGKTIALNTQRQILKATSNSTVLAFKTPGKGVETYCTVNISLGLSSQIMTSTSLPSNSQVGP